MRSSMYWLRALWDPLHPLISSQRGALPRAPPGWACPETLAPGYLGGPSSCMNGDPCSQPGEGESVVWGQQGRGREGRV